MDAVSKDQRLQVVDINRLSFSWLSHRSALVPNYSVASHFCLQSLINVALEADEGRIPSTDRDVATPVLGELQQRHVSPAARSNKEMKTL